MIERKEIRALPAGELLALRTAMLEFQANFNSNGYHDIAGYHGTPHNYCSQAHNNFILFLAWHRYYVYVFEKELRKLNSSLAVPYWDWTAESTFDDCLSPSHKEVTFVDDTGTVKANPLYAALVYDESRPTRRHVTLSRSELETAKGQVNIALGNSTKTLGDLGARLFGPHGTIHFYIGGDFASTPLAAYDPLFWSHHATVDRQWAIWQQLNPTISIPPDILNLPLPGFDGIKVGDVIDYERQLGYKYDNLNSTLHRPGQRGAEDNALVKSKHDQQPLALIITGIHTTAEPYTIELFLRDSKSNRKLAAGVFGIFGMGKMTHAQPMSHAHHAMLFDEYIDVSKALEALQAEPKDVDMDFIVKDRNGKMVDSANLRYDRYEIKQLVAH